MGRTFIRQDTQIRKSDVYDDTIAPSLANYETNTVHIEDDLNSLRSQVASIINRSGAAFPGGDWYADLAAPITFENGTQRGINGLNQQLHDLERKRVLVTAYQIVDVTVGAGNNYVVLALGELPANTTAAIGSVTTLGTVAAYNASFGSHSLAEVTGSTNISPKNLCQVIDSVTHDPILSDQRQIFALFQTESNTDGSTMTGTTPNRAQLSFVRVNAAGNDLEAVPVADIENKVIHFASATRKALEDLNEQDFLRGAELDVPSTSSSTRQQVYNNQGTTPVELTTNALLDLNSAGIYWTIRDLANADLFKITEGSGGGTSTIQFAGDVDTFDNNAVVNDFVAGVTVASGLTRPIRVGVSDGILDTSAGDLEVRAFGELYLDDGNQTGSTWAQTAGIKLSDTTAEWDAFEVAFGGEVSLLSAITSAYNKDRAAKVYSVVTAASIAAGLDVSFADGNVDTAFPDMSGGSFLTDYDVYLNGALLRPGANSSANNDYYPGTSLTPAAQLQFEFVLKQNDVLCIIPYRKP